MATKKMINPVIPSMWARLSKIDCSEHVEKKGNFNYLSWAWAWATLKEHCPGATFEKHWFVMGDPPYSLPYAMDKQGNAYVKVTVTVGEQSITETYPVTNHQNRSIQQPDSMEVNTALQRCLVKAIAFHGLASYLYAGEDLPADTGEKETSAQPIDPVLSDDEEERAAIIQYDGEKSKDDAEREAREEAHTKSVEEWRAAFLDHPEKPVEEKNGKTLVGLPEGNDGYEIVTRVFEVFMPRIGDQKLGNDKKMVVAAMGEFWKANATSLKKILGSSPETHGDILALFSEAKATANRGDVWRSAINS